MLPCLFPCGGQYVYMCRFPILQAAPHPRSAKMMGDPKTWHSNPIAAMAAYKKADARLSTENSQCNRRSKRQYAIYIYIYIYIYICIYMKFVCLSLYIYICVYYIYVCVYIYIYIHMSV